MSHNQSSPAVSVCMPVYNRHEYIRECMDSILAQTFTDFEVVIVDDGSTDDTCEIIESYHDPRIRLIRNRHNFIESSNMTLSLARGKYIARMDSDDIMMPDRLKIQYAYMESHSEIDILGGSRIVMGESDMESVDDYDSDVTPSVLYKQCCLSHPTVMMRTDSVCRVNLKYEQDSIYSEDYLMWIRAMIAGLTIRNLPDVLVKYRVSKSQVSIAHYYTQSRGCRFAQNLLGRWMGREEERLCLENLTERQPSVNSLTVVLPFYNDGRAVVDAVASIRRKVGHSVDIVVVNDQSNDGFPYYESLRPYDVDYVYSAEHVGICRSLLLGVGRASTDYILYLDPRYRLLGAGWVGFVSETLSESSGMLLGLRSAEYVGACEFCFSEKDTSGLLEFEGGRFEDIKGVFSGAWAVEKKRLIRMEPFVELTQNTGDTSVLLSALYRACVSVAMSKQVYKHKAVDMPCHYSMLEEEVIYNQLLVANLFMSTVEKCRKHSMLLSANKFRYHIASLMINDNAEAVSSARCRLGIRPVELPVYADFGGFESGVSLSYAADVMERMKPDGWGICRGAAAKLLWVGVYGMTDATMADGGMCDILADGIVKNVESGSLPVDFRNGLPGVGLALLILNRLSGRNFCEESVLECIDCQIENLTPCVADDFSFMSGLGGVLAYMCRRVDGCFSEEFLQTMDSKCVEILNSDSGQLSSLYAMLYMTARKQVCPINSIDLYWMQTPHYIPSNPEFWHMTMNDGVPGASFKSMIYKHIQKQLCYEAK